MKDINIRCCEARETRIFIIQSQMKLMHIVGEAYQVFNSDTASFDVDINEAMCALEEKKM